MKAVVRHSYGPPSALRIQELDIPTPKDREILVKVHVTTVNRTDCGIFLGKPLIIRFFTGLFSPRKRILGTDFAGEVAAVGKGVSRFRVGDRVFGLNDEGLGSHAQYMVLREDGDCLPMPKGISFEEAVASCEGAHYAYNFVRKARVKKGQRVLVNGATGAIGSAAVQILKHFGAEVTAVCDAKHAEALRSRGADRVVDFTKEDFTREKSTYHFVFDAVGKSSFGKCRSSMLPGAVYASSEPGAMVQNVLLALIGPLVGRRRVVFPIPRDCKRSLRFIGDLAARGRFKPLIDRSYLFLRIAEAYEYVLTGRKIGNVIVSFQPNIA